MKILERTASTKVTPLLMRPSDGCSVNHPDHVTILAVSGRRQTKAYKFHIVDGEIIVPPGNKFGSKHTPKGQTERQLWIGAAHDYSTFATLLSTLNELQEFFVVRAGLYDETGADIVPDASLATLTDVARRWIMIDIDDKLFPPGWPEMPDDGDDPQKHTYNQIDQLIPAHLPEEFHGAGCVVQMSPGATYSHKPNCHLWFLTDKKVLNSQIRQWLNGWPVVDPAVFKPTQPLFTGKPELIDISAGRTPLEYDNSNDPFLRGVPRVFFLGENRRVAVPERFPEIDHEETPSASGVQPKPTINPCFGRDWKWQADLERYGRAKGGHNRPAGLGFNSVHCMVFFDYVTAKYDPHHPDRDIDFEPLYAAIRKAISKCEHHESDDPDREMSDTRMRHLTTWALSSASGAPLKKLEDAEKERARRLEERTAKKAEQPVEGLTYREPASLDDVLRTLRGDD